MMVRNAKYLLLKQKAGKLGGHARIALYGNPGTVEGRAKGGRNSQLTHRRLDTVFGRSKFLNKQWRLLNLSVLSLETVM